MSEPEEEIGRVLDRAGKYLRRQKEVYGETLYKNSAPTRNVSKEADPAPTRVSEVDLFGQATAPPSASDAGSRAQLPNELWAGANNLDVLNGMICTCLKCGLGKTRKNFVFGVGNAKADIVLIGEAPGADEDEQGEPFVGRAGQLLNKILEAVKFKREEVYICNILKCRPPDNRKPAAEEIELCEPYLWKQLEIINPKMILCLGLTAGQALLKTTSSLTNLRGKFHNYRGVPLMVTYHPAALLRNPNWKRPCWEDVQIFRKRYDEISAVR